MDAFEVDNARVTRTRRRTLAVRGRVLVVARDEEARRRLEEPLRAHGFVVSTAADRDEALASVRRAPPDVVLTDLDLDPAHDVELCRHAHDLDPEVAVVVITSSTDMRLLLAGLRAGVTDYVVKPTASEAVSVFVERAIAERAAKVEQKRLRALFAKLSEGVTVVDARGRVVMMNDGARAILGVAADARSSGEEIKAIEVQDLNGRALADAACPFARAMRGEEFVDCEVRLRRVDGEWRRIRASATNVENEKGEAALALVVLRDVTEHARLERHRDEYLALVSHDLRNPLGTIKMCLAAMKRSSRGAEGASLTSPAPSLDLLERADRNVSRMTAMIGELTEASAFETSSVSLCTAPCDLRAVVASVMDTIDDVRARRVTLETDGAASYVVLADASRLERVVTNLLTNALKYSAEDAPVTMKLSRRADQVHLDVTDRGIGIPPEKLTTVFERYFRTTEGKAHANGLGLGLYIARLIADAHDGRVAVVSEVGKGSTFSLILPSHVMSM